MTAAPAPRTPDAARGEVCQECGHIHTSGGCTGPPTASDRWAGVTPAACDCDHQPDAPTREGVSLNEVIRLAIRTAGRQAAVGMTSIQLEDARVRAVEEAVERIVASHEAAAWDEAHRVSCDMANNCFGGCPLHVNPYRGAR